MNTQEQISTFIRKFANQQALQRPFAPGALQDTLRTPPPPSPAPAPSGPRMYPDVRDDYGLATMSPTRWAPLPPKVRERWNIPDSPPLDPWRGPAAGGPAQPPPMPPRPTTPSRPTPPAPPAAPTDPFRGPAAEATLPVSQPSPAAPTDPFRGPAAEATLPVSQPSPAAGPAPLPRPQQPRPDTEPAGVLGAQQTRNRPPTPAPVPLTAQDRYGQGAHRTQRSPPTTTPSMPSPQARRGQGVQQTQYRPPTPAPVPLAAQDRYGQGAHRTQYSPPTPGPLPLSPQDRRSAQPQPTMREGTPDVPLGAQLISDDHMDYFREPFRLGSPIAAVPRPSGIAPSADLGQQLMPQDELDRYTEMRRAPVTPRPATAPAVRTSRQAPTTAAGQVSDPVATVPRPPSVDQDQDQDRSGLRALDAYLDEFGTPRSVPQDIPFGERLIRAQQGY